MLAFGISTIASFVFYYILGNFTEALLFEQITLIKRIASTFIVFLLLGLGVSIPRQVAYEKEKDANNSIKFFNASLLIISTIGITFFIIVNVFSNNVANLLFNNDQYQQLVLPLSLFILAQLYSGIVFSFLRGNLKIEQSNYLTIINAIIPIASLLLFPSATSFLVSCSLLYCFSGFVILFRTYRIQTFIDSFRIKTLVPKVTSLLKIGVPRVPGDFALEALLTIPITLTAHYSGSWEASLLAFSLTILTMCVSLLSPINLILLPYASKFLSLGKKQEIKSHTLLLLKISLPMIVVITIIVFFSSDFICTIFLKDSYNYLATVFLKTVVWACIPYSIYVVLRSFIDAAYELPMNAINVVLGLSSFFIVFFIIKDIQFLKYPSLVSMIFGFIVISILSLNSFYKYFSKKD